MHSPHEIRETFRFGTFCLDTTSGVLVRDGFQIRLDHQSSVVLRLLLEARGEVVPREALQNALWADAVSGDHNNGINRIVSRLRTCLRDTSRPPLYIETLPKRGYRFLAEVEEVETREALTPGPETQPFIETDLPFDLTEQIAVADLGQSDSLQQYFLRTSVQLSVGIPLLLAGLLLLVLWPNVNWKVLSRHIEPPATAHRTVQLDLRGDDIDTNLQAGILAGQLQSDFNGMPQTTFHRATVSAKSDSSSTPPSQETNASDDLVVGSLHHLGDGYKVSIQVRSAAQGTTRLLEYNVPADHISALHLQLQHDLYQRYFRSSVFAQVGTGKQGPSREMLAYDSYLQAEPLIAERSQESLAHAKALLQQALVEHPEDAFSLARLSLASMLENLYSDAPSVAAFEQSARLAHDALELDPSLAEAHAVLGFIAYHENWQFRTAEGELREAVRLEPSNPQFRSWLALLLSYEGDGDAAVEQIRIARRFDDQSLCLRTNEITILASAKRFEDMLQTAQANATRHPDEQAAFEQLGWALWTTQHYEAAVMAWTRRARIAREWQSVSFESKALETLRNSGMQAYAELKARSIASGTLPVTNDKEQQLAEWYGYAGRPEAALNSLQKQLVHHTAGSLSTRVDPAFASLRGDSRFQLIVDQIGEKPKQPAFSTYASTSVLSLN